MGFYAVIALFFGYPLLVLSPLLRFVRHHRKPVTAGEFSMSDLFALTFLIPLPLVALQMRDVRSWDREQVITQIVFAVCSLIIPTLVWFLGLRAANHLGIKDQWRRLVIIGFTFPAAILGAFCLPAVAVFPELATRYFPISVIVYCAFTLTAFVSGAWVIKGCALGLELNAINGDGRSGR